MTHLPTAAIQKYQRGPGQECQDTFAVVGVFEVDPGPQSKADPASNFPGFIVSVFFEDQFEIEDNPAIDHEREQGPILADALGQHCGCAARLSGAGSTG